jgi:hypothetical protein
VFTDADRRRLTHNPHAIELVFPTQP